jgi:hypothetical protein
MKMDPSAKHITIGNAGGYWGDDPHALARQIQGKRLDYISIDFLAEITMSIMQKQRSRDPSLGYARDYIHMLEPILGSILERKTTIITNAGGVNPDGCAEAILRLAQRLGLKLRISVVQGDDILEQLETLESLGVNFQNMETGESFESVRSQIQAANIYFGAQPVVEALKDQPDLIVTGRVTDTGITIAPMIHEFGWGFRDWDKLASGIVAGHLLECGNQSTGGNFTDWKHIKNWDQMGYPYVEVSPDGSFVVTKHEGSGGLVSLDTCREQLFYEMGDPSSYITPDVVADFTSIQLADAGPNRVRVSGVKGMEPTPLYKVSMAYSDGFKAQGTILISGPEARAKAELFSRIFWNRCTELEFAETATEYVGWNACHRSLGHRDDGNEIILKLSARGYNADHLKQFAKLVPSLILSGPPGVAVLGGVPKAQDVISYWPALMPKEHVNPKVKTLASDNQQSCKERTVSVERGEYQPLKTSKQVAESVTTSLDSLLKSLGNTDLPTLKEIALARSGDKGDMCNIGVMARSPEAYVFLKEYLTAQRVKDWFQELCVGPVVRFEVENLSGFNFLLEHALGGGGTKTLRSDAQGKTFAQALLRQHVAIPDSVLKSVKE